MIMHMHIIPPESFNYTLNNCASFNPSDSGIDPSRKIMTCSSSLLDDSSGIVSGNGPAAAAPPVILLLALQFPPDDVGSASFSSYNLERERSTGQRVFLHGKG